MGFLISVPEPTLVPRDSTVENFAEILRDAQTAGWTDKALEKASGVKSETIQAYRRDGKEPSLSKAYSILLALGSKSVNKSTRTLMGYSATAHDEPDEKPCGAVVACILTHGGVIATAAADGRIDHTEAPGCREAADSILEAVVPLSSAGVAA